MLVAWHSKPPINICLEGLISKLERLYTIHKRKPSNLIFLEKRKGSEKHSLKEDKRPTVHEKVLNPTNHQGNVNQKPLRSPHTCQDVYYQKENITSVRDNVEKNVYFCIVPGSVN